MAEDRVMKLIIHIDDSLKDKEPPQIEIGSFELYKNWPLVLKLKKVRESDEEKPTEPLR